MTILYSLINYPTGLSDINRNIGIPTKTKIGNTLRVQTTHPMQGVSFDFYHDGTNKIIKVPVNVTSGNVGLMIGRKDGNNTYATSGTSPFFSNPVNTSDVLFHNPIKNEEFYLSVYSDWYDTTRDPVYGILGSLENPARRCKIGYKLNSGDTPTLIKQFPDSDRTFVMDYKVTPSGRLLILVIQRYGSSSAYDPTSPYPNNGTLDDRDFHYESLKLIEVNLNDYTILREQTLLDYSAVGTPGYHRHNHGMQFLEAADGTILILTMQSIGTNPWHFMPDIMYSESDGWTFTKLGSYYADEGDVDEPEFCQVSDNEYVLIGRSNSGKVWKAKYNHQTKIRTKFQLSDIVASSNTNRTCRLPDGRQVLSWTANNSTGFLPRTLATIGISSDGFDTFDEIYFHSFVPTNVAYGSASYQTGINDWKVFIGSDGKLNLWSWNNSFVPKNFLKTMTIPEIREGYSVSKLTGQNEELSVNLKDLPSGNYTCQICGVRTVSSDFLITDNFTIEDAIIEPSFSIPLISKKGNILTISSEINGLLEGEIPIIQYNGINMPLATLINGVWQSEKDFTGLYGNFSFRAGIQRNGVWYWSNIAEYEILPPQINISIEPNPFLLQSFGTYNINLLGTKKIGYLIFTSQNINSNDIVAFEWSTNQLDWTYNQINPIPENKYCKINLYGDTKYYFRFSVLQGTDYFFSDVISSDEFYKSPIFNNLQYIKVSQYNYLWLTCDIDNLYGNENVVYQISQDQNTWNDVNLNYSNNSTQRYRFDLQGKSGTWYYRVKLTRIDDVYYSNVASFNLDEFVVKNAQGYNPTTPKNAIAYKSAIINGFKLGSMKLGRIFKEPKSIAVFPFIFGSHVLGSFVQIDITMKCDVNFVRFWSNQIEFSTVYNLLRYYSNLSTVEINYNLVKVEILRLVAQIQPELNIQFEHVKDIKIKCKTHPEVTLETLLNKEHELTSDMQFDIQVEAL